MYNGIGLSTVRGSGTSGYVQRNLSHVPATEKRKIDYKTESDLSKEEKIRGPNQGILDHEKKRKIEVKCAELEDLLVDQNLGEEEINEKVTAYRKMLMQSVDIDDAVELDDFGRPIIKATDSHQVAKMQNERNEKLKAAFGIMSQEEKVEEEKKLNERAEKETRRQQDDRQRNRKEKDKQQQREKRKGKHEKDRKDKSSLKRKRKYKSSSSSSSESSSSSSDSSSSSSEDESKKRKIAKERSSAKSRKEHRRTNEEIHHDREQQVCQKILETLVPEPLKLMLPKYRDKPGFKTILDDLEGKRVS